MTSSSLAIFKMCFHLHDNIFSERQRELQAFLQQSVFAFENPEHASLELLLLHCADELHDGKMLLLGLTQLFPLSKLFSHRSRERFTLAPEEPSPAAALVPAVWYVREHLAPVIKLANLKAAVH